MGELGLLREEQTDLYIQIGTLKRKGRLLGKFAMQPTRKKTYIQLATEKLE